MDYGRSLTFMFEDPNWIGKMLIGALLTLLGMILLPVLLIGLVFFLPVSGYVLRLARQIMNGEGDALPNWDNFGDLIAEGSKLAAALFIYALPALLLEIPVIISSVLMNNSQDMSAIGALLSMSCGCLLFIYGILLALVSPIVIVLVAKENRFGAAFDFTAIWNILKSHFGEVVVIAVIEAIAGLVVSLVGLLVLVISVFFTSFWLYLVQGHLVGQLGRLAFAPAMTVQPPASVDTLLGIGQPPVPPAPEPPVPPVDTLPGPDQPPAPEPPRPPSADA